MTRKPNSNLIIGILCVAFAVFAIFVWIPLDTDTGMLEKVRRRIVIGDALAPTVAAGFVGIGGLLLIIFERKAPDQPAVRLVDLGFISVQMAILIIGFVIMLFAGPITVALSGVDSEYRLLRDTAPWKYIGYFLGGVVIISGMICHSEGRFSKRSVVIGVCVVIGLIAIYDLPFEDLLLPPNGDF